jgi:hypothetical protein
MTLGNAAAPHVRLIVWCLPFREPHGFAGCRDRRHQVEPDPAEMARFTPAQHREAIHRCDGGESVRAIARRYNINPSTIFRLTA